jgi:CRP/FNR family transcriptional regulator, cyclic AMP receptor protein
MPLVTPQRAQHHPPARQPRHNAHMPTPKILNPAIQTLADAGTLRSYKKGAIIVSEGDSGDTLMVLLSGSVRVYGTDTLGREVTYATISAPDYFGEMSLDGGARSASIEAVTPCDCAVLTRVRVHALLSTSPDLALELITKITARARAATITIRNLALMDAYGRLAATLNELAEEPDAQGARAIPERTTHADLAQRIGTSREMVSRLLRDLEKGGYISVDKRSMTLVKKLPAKW